MSKESMTKKLTVEGTICGFSNIFAPSTMYSKDGEYQAVIKTSESIAKPILGDCEALLEAQYDKYRKNSKKIEVTAIKPLVFVEKDENGRIIKETPDKDGAYVLKAKNKAYIKDGAIGLKIPVFDAKLNPITAPIKFGNGTKVRLGITLEGYSTNLGTGVSVKLRMVQLLNVVDPSGYKAEDFFTVEDGYEFDGTAVEEAAENDVEEDF